MQLEGKAKLPTVFGLPTVYDVVITFIISYDFTKMR